jgi:hypothetical protein
MRSIIERVRMPLGVKPTVDKGFDIPETPIPCTFQPHELIKQNGQTLTGGIGSMEDLESFSGQARPQLAAAIYLRSSALRMPVASPL